MDREESKPTAVEAVQTDIVRALGEALISGMDNPDQIGIPNTIIMIRADVLSIAIHEIEMLRGQLRDREMLAGAIGGFRTKEGIEP